MTGTKSTNECQEQYKIVQAVSTQIQHEQYRIKQQQEHLERLWGRYHAEQEKLTRLMYG